jgi:hypothetical protein
MTVGCNVGGLASTVDTATVGIFLIPPLHIIPMRAVQTEAFEPAAPRADCCAWEHQLWDRKCPRNGRSIILAVEKRPVNQVEGE